VSTRQEREAEFHDRLFVGGKRPEAAKFYAIDRRSSEYYGELLEARAAGSRILEYGCGPGSAAFFLAERGAHVDGIDISSVAIDKAAEAAREQGVDDRTSFQVMDAEALAFDDGSFDVVCGTGILHHLDLERAYRELARVLKPGGEAIFMEPMGHNPVINLYRRRTPELRTEDEHPLLMKDLERAETYFGEVRPRFFHLQSLLAVPLRGRRSFERFLSALETADDRLFRLAPPLRRYAWMTVVRLAQPKPVQT
jgi:SAM-dependent methyltransferase